MKRCGSQCLGVECVCNNGDVTLTVYTHCKRCGDKFRDVAGADYSDGLCSVECLKAENDDVDFDGDNA
jgi:hypothetical protein